MGANEQKFKVGDRVRCLSVAGGGQFTEGRIYEVVRHDGDLVQCINDEGYEEGMYAYRFELVEQSWQPKVGDLVTCTLGLGNGTVYETSNNGKIRVRWDTGGGEAWWGADKWEPLPVAEQPEAPLQIVAGRYYKTRDGRKAGPSELRDADIDDPIDYPWLVPVGGDSGHYVYTSDGRYSIGGSFPEHDLIAEWVDEPTETVAATASNDNSPTATPQQSATTGFTSPLVVEQPATPVTVTLAIDAA
ncbi:hypothetical protein EHS39_30080, partial [Ensifer sp. MPMI2T]